MKAGRAFLAGVVGGTVMSAGLAMGRAMGMPANLEVMLGTMIMPAGTTAWIVGFLMHLMISGLIALVYGVAFEYLLHRSGWTTGAFLGIVHSLIAGVFMGMMPAMHPMIPEQMPAPGAFMSNLGIMGIMAEILLHIIYGAIVGAIYGPVQHLREQHA